MVTITARPSTTPTLVRVEVERELSGSAWCSRFPGDNNVSALDPSFRPNVEAFLDALKEAGAKRSIGAVFRPQERAYLMHWSYSLYKGRVTADRIPSLDGVAINWVHPSVAESVAAAKAMCVGYNIQDLGTTPALHSQHEVRLAIDVSIHWTGTLVISNKDGTEVSISTEPRTGMNRELIDVGATYGVIKYNRTGTDKPHWSSTGA